MQKEIIIIGGGISGITTALTLQLLGYETEIYTDKLATETKDKRSNPEFASLYPSASIIPHSVFSNKLKELFLVSQSFFYELRKLTFPGITIHKHYEIFESENEQPEYCNWMPNFQTIDDLDPDEIPRRTESNNLHGWAFDCIFADWPLYLPALTRLYNEAGGSVTKCKLAAEDIAELSAEIVINCSGVGSPSLFEDPSDTQLLMCGYLLHKPDAPLLTNSNSEIVSYNYTPEASVYADANGDACDVYCYPRKDGWILGGSRQLIELKNIGVETEELHEDGCEIDGIKLPRQIIELNKEILDTTFNAPLDKSDPFTPVTGYRYIRNRDDGLRLDHEELSGKKVYHNYGHGGAGVTLSWGCALNIAKQITTEEIQELKSSILKKISTEDFQLQ